MKKISLRCFLSVGCLVFLFGARMAEAEVKMPLIFGDHMVLQQEMKIPVWGTAEPGEDVSVQLGDNKMQATADGQGKWRVDLPALPDGTAPQTLIVTGKSNALQFQDVLVGDVWFAGGQSNMSFGVWNNEHAKDEVPKANFPQIRLFVVPMRAYVQPQDDLHPSSKPGNLEAHWQVCTPDTLGRDGEWGGFSAVAYFFGRELNESLKRPIGLIDCAWGGTPVQAWMSPDAFQNDPVLKHYSDGYQTLLTSLLQPDGTYKDLMEQFKAEDTAFKDAQTKWTADAAAAKASNQPEPPKPSGKAPWHPEWRQVVLYNAMIAPIIPYALKGVIWYQGEANEHNAPEYGKLLSAMITDWRAKWGEGDFPFLIVELANYRAPAKQPVEGDWAMVRDGQVKALALPNTGMAVAIDLGDPNNIHPKNKIDVAHRLALAAKHVAYGQELVYSGPTYDSMQIDGGKIIISFKNMGGGLIMGTPPWTYNGQPVPPPTELTGFAIAGSDQKWVWAKAEIDGSSVVVSADSVPNPVAVRYGWADNPPCNLYNKENLPASPFRTDDWPK